MTVEPPSYMVIGLFGKEHIRSVAAPDVFQQLVGALSELLQSAGCTLNCRGIVEGSRGKNLAPRKAALTTKVIERWKEQLAGGIFKQFEIFDAAWSDEHFPAVYAGINKLWGFSPAGYTERTKYAAENNITIAIRSDLSRLGDMERAARGFIDLISAFYGFIAPDVQWDRAKTPEGPREDMIDAWWYNRTSGDYRRGQYRMDEMIPRLYWGNVLSSSHFKAGGPGSLPPSMASCVETWGDRLFYVRFVKNPRSEADLDRALTPYFNIVPG